MKFKRSMSGSYYIRRNNEFIEIKKYGDLWEVYIDGEYMGHRYTLKAAKELASQI